MERSVKRPNNIPGKLSDAEKKDLERRAEEAGFKHVSLYVRELLGLPGVPVGRPKGSPNRKKEV